MLFAVCVPAEAQQAKKVPRIGYLSNSDPARESTRAEAIRLALRERGYIEGQNIAIEYRYGEGKIDRAPELVAEFVRLNVDIIVVAGGTRLWVRPAMNATKTIPIIMMGAGTDPVEAGVIDSLTRPGGNVTGLTLLSRELGGKRLELLKEAVPKVTRVAVLYDRPLRHCTRGERGSSCRSTWAELDCSALGRKSCGRFREGIRCAKQEAPGWTLCTRRGPANQC
jgi:putative tryptophan/tyrosine transport system substrate-binding protein